MILVPGFCHLHRVVSSGHSKVVLDQFCPRGERKLKKSWSDTNLNGILKGRLCFTLKATVLTCFSTSVTPGSFPTEAKTSLLPMSITPTWTDYQKTSLICCCWFSNQIIRKEAQFIFVDFQINFQSSLHSQPGSLYRKSSLDWIHPEKKKQWLEIICLKMKHILPGM